MFTQYSFPLSEQGSPWIEEDDSFSSSSYDTLPLPTPHLEDISRSSSNSSFSSFAYPYPPAFFQQPSFLSAYPLSAFSDSSKSQDETWIPDLIPADEPKKERERSKKFVSGKETGPWTPSSDRKLVAAVEQVVAKHRAIKWPEVSKLLNGVRTGKSNFISLFYIADGVFLSQR
jgi:hypothetical protein